MRFDRGRFHASAEIAHVVYCDLLYISHRIEEIFEISDRIMVMRDGRSVGVMLTKETDSTKVISLMVGREINDLYPHREPCKMAVN